MPLLSASVVFSPAHEGRDVPPQAGRVQSRAPVYPTNEMSEVVVDPRVVELSTAPQDQANPNQGVGSIPPAPSRTPSEGQALANFQAGAQGRQVHGVIDGEEIPFRHLIGYVPKPGWSPGDPLNEECAICMTELSIDEVLSTLPCGHSFHHSCIAAWFKQRISHGQDGKCPGCNHVVVQAVDLNGAPVLPTNAISSYRARRAERARLQLLFDTEMVQLFPIEFFPCCSCKWAHDMRVQRCKRRLWFFAFALAIVILINVIIVISDLPE